MSSTSSTWNHEADVVIVGYGGAGACAAIGAHDAGAKVVILEKMPQTYEGGNTRVSMGGIVFPTNLADGIEYVRALSFGTVKEEELFRTYVAGALEIPHWVERLGGRLTFAKAAPTFPSLPGSKSITTSHRMEGGGPALFQFLSNHVKSRKIEILYETRAKELIQDSKTRKIRGVKAEGSSKEEIVIKARRAVILACGGYQNDTEMHSCFHFPGLRIYPAGTPSNTGDGIKMALKAGAELWHNASFEWYEVSIKPLQNNDCAIPMNIPVFRSPSYIFVNRYGKRFRDESRSWIHRKDPRPETYFNHETAEYPNMPCYIIFDENLRPQGPLVRSRSPTTNAPLGFLPVYGIYKWSDDNLAEIENGIIKKADTIRIIAASIGAEPTLLEETIAAYNRYCDTGNDPEFKRPREKLVPIKGPPYYFAELCLAFINTQGGPRHNSKAQVLDWNGDPIPRLYAAGECGSMFGFLYQGGSNLAEAIVFGRIAGKNAATETL